MRENGLTRLYGQRVLLDLGDRMQPFEMQRESSIGGLLQDLLVCSQVRARSTTWRSPGYRDVKRLVGGRMATRRLRGSGSSRGLGSLCD